MDWSAKSSRSIFAEFCSWTWQYFAALRFRKRCELKAEDSAKDQTISPYGEEVGIICNFVSLEPVASAYTEIPHREVFHAAFDMKQMFTLKNDGSEIIEELNSSVRIVIEIVTYCRSQLGN